MTAPYSQLRSTLIGILLLGLQACSRDTPEPTTYSTATELNTNAAIVEAKNWFNQASNNTTNINWEEARSTGQWVVAPLFNTFNPFPNSNRSAYRYFIARTGVNKNYTGNIIEIVGEEQSLTTEHAVNTILTTLERLHTRQSTSELSNFTGWIIFYSPTYTYQTSLVYKAGHLQSEQVRLQPSKPSKPSISKDNDGTMVTNLLDGNYSCISETHCGYAGEYQSTCITTQYCVENGSGGGSGGDTGGGNTGGGVGWGGGSNGGSSPSVNPNNVYLYDGQRPSGEYRDRCSGVQALWNLGVANNNAETVGVITTDGQFLVVAVVGTMGGGWGGLYHFNSGVGSGVDYYQWPDSQGAPTQTYQGMLHSSGHWFIPVAATVHTHTPCLSDGTDGISNMTLSQGDQNLASNFPNINHYIVGCNALGTFSNASNSPSVLTTGALSNTCSSL
jgi:uncharacterized membrane protein YgcG